MKTYKITGLLLGLLLCTSNSVVSNYYVAGQDIVRENFTYKCEKEYSFVKVYNVNNRWTGIEQTRLSGRPMPVELPDDVRAMTSSSYHHALNTIFEVADSVFSNAEKATIKTSEERMLLLLIFIDSQTGEVTEVEYTFFPNGGYAKIPPEKYFAMEQLLKQKIRVELTDEGRSRNYNVIVYPLLSRFLKQ